MPKRSAASLSVVPVVPGRGRPKPPADLDPIEQRVWREVVGALPGHWLDTAGQLVLRRLAAQAAVSERQGAKLRRLRAEDQDDGEEAAVRASQHGSVAKNVAYLLTQLRATPKAQLRSSRGGYAGRAGAGKSALGDKGGRLGRVVMNPRMSGLGGRAEMLCFPVSILCYPLRSALGTDGKREAAVFG
jgi:hypothetical protein